ncbi:helix-turn-helix domain-containing protein [Oceanobacillus picturae]|uniref:helix-turn-helix domain-containing protein n=1 Tax=Oceanobacillus picturae TaxID=171693 RepID=UPI003630DAD0
MVAQTKGMKKSNEIAKEEVSDEFGLLFKRYRRKKGYSLKQLESITNVDHTFINRIENGKRSQISFSKAIRLAFHLDLPYESLISTVLSGNSSLAVNKNIGLTPELKEEIMESYLRTGKDIKQDILELIDFIINSKWDTDNKVRELYLISEKVDMLKEKM